MKIKKIILLPINILKIISIYGGLWQTLKKVSRFIHKNGITQIKTKFFRAYDSSVNNNYQKWIHQFDTIDDNKREKIRSEINQFPKHPLISIILPVFNPKSRWLVEALDSVINQLYPHWELCIADDCSTYPEIRTILETYQKKDPRIHVIFRRENGHISAASNSALVIANEEWVALLDHDDLLPETALFWVAEAILKNPDAKLIYSDEDKINSRGKRIDPYFKPDWNRDLFYSHNMITHLGIYKKETVKEIKGFREGFEGAQDYDLALRFIEKIDESSIIHIPRILYHWRVHNKSTAYSNDTKPYAAVAGEKALNEHFQRIKSDSWVEFLPEGHGFRAHHALPSKRPLVSIIIPTKNNKQYLERCITSILTKTTYENYHICVVDNGSTDTPTLSYLKALSGEPRITVKTDNSPFNFSAINNKAANLAEGEILAFLNDDTEVITPEWLSEMVSLAVRPQTGAVGARLWYSNNTLQHAGIICGLGGYAGHAHQRLPKGEPGYIARAVLIQNFSAVTAACMVIKKEIFTEVGGFNEKDFAIAYNDVDLCLKIIQAGYRNVWTPYAELYHYESISRGYEETPEKIDRFEREKGNLLRIWGDFLQTDPAYNPNLTKDYDNFSLAWPPRVKSNPSPENIHS